MAKKIVVIPKSELIPIDGKNEYLVRFRITSDDRNRFSEWSSIFSVLGTGVAEIPEFRVASFTNNSIVTIVWDGLPSNNTFDIFVSYDGGLMTYHGSSSENRYMFIHPANIQTYKFSIQVASVSKEYNQSLQVFESEVLSVV